MFAFFYRKANKNDYKIKIFEEKKKKGNEDYAEPDRYEFYKLLVLSGIQT